MRKTLLIAVGTIACAGASLAQTQPAQQATAEQIENFKKAFSVCLEAENYMVKF